MPFLPGMSVIAAPGRQPTVILLTPKRGKASPDFLKADGVSLAEFLDDELPAVTFQALAQRAAEMNGLIEVDDA